MKIEVEIEVTEDGTYGAPLARRKLSLEAAQIPSSFGHITGDVTNQTIAEAEEKKKVRDLKEETNSVPPVRPFNETADAPL